MTERLSDERLRELCDPVPKAMPAAEVPAMASELLELRAKLAAGPVMPEVPSESVQIVIIDTVNNAIAGRGNWSCYGLYVDIRAALLKEQSR